MKQLLFIFLFLLLQSFVLNAQKIGDVISFVDEVTISLNKTRISNESRIRKGTVGFGFNKIWLDSNRFNFGLGFYYERTRQFRTNYEIDIYDNLLDANLSLDNLSIPLFCRFNIGKETNFFVETGVFIDIFNRGKVSGYENYKETILTKRDLFTRKINIGISGGVGLLILTGKYELILKSEFKYGLLDVIPNDDEGWQNQYFKFSLGMGL